MVTKRMLLTVLAASAVLLALVLGSQLAGSAQARPPTQSSVPASVTIPYPGRLADVAGLPVPDGAYDFAFTLYTAETGGAPLWSEVQKGVPVQGGAFQAALGRVQPIPPAALNGPDAWLAVAVRGPGAADLTALAPRQRVSAAPTAPDSPSAGLACPHDHLGEWWSGSRTDYLLKIENTSTGDGIRASSSATSAFVGALYGYSTSSGTGVLGSSANGHGVFAIGDGSGHDHAALRANNIDAGCGVAAYLTSNSGCPTLEIDKTGAGGAAIDLQLFNPGNVDPAMFIKAYDENTILQFLVSTNGIVAANGYIDWKADMAEMLPAAKGLEPGDVLAIGPDGDLILSTEPYQTSVAGVYSTDPGFMFGHPLEGKTPGTIPLAMTGVVPVKVSAENGPIRPGDLLVTSATPGYAMRAGPNPPQGTVIGKALEKWDTGTGVIKLLATLQ
ncbi:MAG: hypothetical protein KKA73_29755 [Chloroflexi bacterium]|nr:hypothetical protein [Chloroflexota bacterium]MBU1751884.1 hypothetical protein [Chloroflexota bacterium]